jgi:predicted ATPase/DNA-binding CsgD family transcriptional regulator
VLTTDQPVVGRVPDLGAERSAPQATLAVLDALIGRDAELALALNLLENPSVRLLTLVGPAGVGKTRFALELARVVQGRFPDGVWFVDLTDIRDAARIPEAVARTLGLRDAQRPAADVLEVHLGSRQALLILDNLEHLSGAATSVAALLRASPGLRVLATSREALRLHGEQRLPIPPLTCPPPNAVIDSTEELERSSAVRLFLERARAVAPDFALTPANARTVARLCASLDGLPLALELVAARADVFSPEVMLERLSRGEPLATSGAADGPARHRSLEAALDWSYALLRPDQQALLRRLAVFEGGWSVAAARWVADTSSLGLDAFEGLLALVDRNLVRAVGTQVEPRFALLETMRVFALSRLAESRELNEIAARHAAYFLWYAETAETHLRGAEQMQWFEHLERDFDNLRAALRWAQDHDPETARRLGAALWRFWDTRGYRSEGRRWLEAMCVDAKLQTPTPALAKVLLACGALALSAGDLSAAEPWLERSRAAFESLQDELGAADAASLLGTAAYVRFERERADVLYVNALGVKRRLGDRHGTADLLVSLGMVLRDRGELERAEAFVEEGLSIHRTVGNLTGVASSLLRLGSVVIDREQLERAAQLFTESHALFTRLGQDQGAAAALIGLGELERLRGDLRGAATPWAHSLQLLYRIGQPFGVSWCLETLAEVAALSGHQQVAARLLGSSMALRDALGVPSDPDDAASRQQRLEQIRNALGPDVFASAFEEGRRSPLGTAVEVALQLERDLHAPPAPRTASELPSSAPSSNAVELSGRELEVLRLVAQGMSNKRVARALGLSDNTVKFHLNSVFNKLGCRTRAEATRLAVERGWLESVTAEAEPRT